MEETIKAIINYLFTQNGGDVFIGECCGVFDYPNCRGIYMSPLNQCNICNKRYKIYNINKDYLDHVKEIYEKEAR